MDKIHCEIRLSEEAEGKPRLVGVLLPFGQQAKDRSEIFERGSVSWPDGGVVLRRQHQRSSPILRFTPIEDAEGLKVDTLIPPTVAGIDAAEEIRSGLLTGLSVEFRAIRQSVIAGVRRISEAVLTGAGLVDNSSYVTTVEVEARAERARARWREVVL